MYILSIPLSLRGFAKQSLLPPTGQTAPLGNLAHCDNPRRYCEWALRRSNLHPKRQRHRGNLAFVQPLRRLIDGQKFVRASLVHASTFCTLLYINILGYQAHFVHIFILSLPKLILWARSLALPDIGWATTRVAHPISAYRNLLLCPTSISRAAKRGSGFLIFAMLSQA